MRWSKFNRLSAYARADNHLAQQTSYGAVGVYILPDTSDNRVAVCIRLDALCAVTICGVCLAILLFFAEIGRHNSAHRVTTVCHYLAMSATTVTLSEL